MNINTIKEKVEEYKKEKQKAIAQVNAIEGAIQALEDLIRCELVEGKSKERKEKKPPALDKSGDGDNLA